jgi:type I restriction enzyme S subunit
MKSNWPTKKLGEILTLEYGKPLPKSKRNAAGKYPVYGANGEKDRSDEYFTEKRSIIVGRKGSAGELTISEDRFWPLDVTYFITFDDTKYDLFFLYHLLITQNLPGLAKGVKPGINRNEVYALSVRVPPLSEQRRIVKILDEVFEKTAKAKENTLRKLDDLEELKKSILSKAFTQSL